MGTLGICFLRASTPHLREALYAATRTQRPSTQSNDCVQQKGGEVVQVWATVVHGSAGLHDAVAAGGVTVVVPPDFVDTSIAWPMPALMDPPVAAETRSLQYAPARHVEMGLDVPAPAAPPAPASPAPASHPGR